MRDREIPRSHSNGGDNPPAVFRSIRYMVGRSDNNPSKPASISIEDMQDSDEHLELQQDVMFDFLERLYEELDAQIREFDCDEYDYLDVIRVPRSDETTPENESGRWVSSPLDRVLVRKVKEGWLDSEEIFPDATEITQYESESIRKARAEITHKGEIDE